MFPTCKSRGAVCRIAAAAVAFLVARAAGACESCYGQQASGPMIDGMNTAILFMLGVIGAVLLVVAAFFVYMWRRGRRITEFHQVPQF